MGARGEAWGPRATITLSKQHRMKLAGGVNHFAGNARHVGHAVKHYRLRLDISGCGKMFPVPR